MENVGKSTKDEKKTIDSMIIISYHIFFEEVWKNREELCRF